jgi:hypothetical protein
VEFGIPDAKTFLEKWNHGKIYQVHISLWPIISETYQLWRNTGPWNREFLTPRLSSRNEITAKYIKATPSSAPIISELRARKEIYPFAPPLELKSLIGSVCIPPPCTGITCWLRLPIPLFTFYRFPTSVSLFRTPTSRSTAIFTSHHFVMPRFLDNWNYIFVCLLRLQLNWENGQTPQSWRNINAFAPPAWTEITYRVRLHPPCTEITYRLRLPIRVCL